MPRELDRQTLIHAVVSPRFEVFYALQALESGAGEHLDEWRRSMDRKLPARLRTSLASVAPSPLIWPVLADSLRELPPSAGFGEMLEALSGMDTRTFQTFVLGGVFKTPGSVDELVSGSKSLSNIVALEAKTQARLLALLGLQPFVSQNPSAKTFERLVKDPASYREEVVSAVDSFWTAGFSETWHQVEGEMRDRATQLRNQAARTSFATFAAERSLPITIDGDEIVTMRSGIRTAAKSASVYLIPSVFNTGKLWAAYSDSRGRTRFFLPVLDSSISPAARASLDPALIFRALGDTTRYAMAASIARTPMTSVELARAFSVSKPTVSHHVQLMRSAGLIEEAQGENGVVLALNRQILERASTEAAREMFSDDPAKPVIRRTRRANK
jgi:DNA-binding transcriptional ArsR family regulator